MCIISHCLFEYQPCSPNEKPSSKEIPSLRLLRFTYLTLLLWLPCPVNCHKHNAVLLHSMFWKPELSLHMPTWHFPLSVLCDRIRISLENFFPTELVAVISVQMTQLCMGFIFSVCSVGSSEDRWRKIRKHTMNWQYWRLIEPLQCSQKSTQQKQACVNHPGLHGGISLHVALGSFSSYAISLQYTVQ